MNKSKKTPHIIKVHWCLNRMHAKINKRTKREREVMINFALSLFNLQFLFL